MVEFAGYQNIQPLAEGGLGRLYKATRISTGGTVAIKELREMQFASDASHRARRELGALLKLKGHPFVVSVEEIIEGPNGPCIVMEFAPGGSLYDLVQQRPLDGPELVLAGQHVVSALSAAHEVGIIHRDVKPHNLLIGSFGQVKVCDFGIAALYLGPSGRTQTQALTLAYASPEELDGDQEVGPPADVYSFGATWVHLMTGKRPTFKDRLSGSSLDISLPTGVVEPGLRSMLLALRSSLAHDPADRPTMDDLRQVFDSSAVALGDRRLHRLAAQPPSSTDAPLPVVVGSSAVEPDVVLDVTSSELLDDRAITPPAAIEATDLIDADDLDGETIIRRPAPVASEKNSTAPNTRRKPRVALIAGAALVLVAGGITAVALSSGSSGDTPSAATATSSSPAPSTSSRAVAPTSTVSAAVLAPVQDAYAAANDKMDAAYGPIIAKYFDTGFVYTDFAQQYPNYCAEVLPIELAYWDVILHLDTPTEEIRLALEAEQFAEGDLIGALDTCSKAARVDKDVQQVSEVVDALNTAAVEANAKSHQALGVPEQASSSTGG